MRRDSLPFTHISSHGTAEAGTASRTRSVHPVQSNAVTERTAVHRKYSKHRTLVCSPGSTHCLDGRQTTEETRFKLIAFPRELIYKVPLVLGTKYSVQYIKANTALQLVLAHLCTARRNRVFRLCNRLLPFLYRGK